MNEKEKFLFASSWMFYMPYTLEDALENHCKKNVDENQKQLAEIERFTRYIDNKRSIWNTKDDSITIEQESADEIGTIIFIGYAIEKIEIHSSNNIRDIYTIKTNIDKNTVLANIDIDFNEHINLLKFYFKYDLSEPYELVVNLIKYKEPAIDYNAIYNENMNIEFGVGQDLINIYFNHAKEDINKVEIELYKVSDKKNLD